jgi:hypothetical protein
MKHISANIRLLSTDYNCGSEGTLYWTKKNYYRPTSFTSSYSMIIQFLAGSGTFFSHDPQFSSRIHPGSCPVGTREKTG